MRFSTFALEGPGHESLANSPLGERRTVMSGLTETGVITGTKDRDYNLTWYVQWCLSNALRMETYRQDAARDNDAELVDLFTRAQEDCRRGAEVGKRLLAGRLAATVPAEPVAGDATTGGEEPPTDVMAPNQATEPEEETQRPGIL
jgi:hypothetical protein